MMIVTRGNTNQSGSWHVGEPLILPPGPVITFQADGHELEFLLNALSALGVDIKFSDALTPIY